MNNYTVLCTEKFSVTTLESTRMKRSFRLSVKDAPLTNSKWSMQTNRTG